MSNETYKKEIQKEWDDYIKINVNGSVSPSVLWDAAKAVIRGKIIALTSRIKKQREHKRLEIEKEIKRLECEHKKSRNTNSLDLLNKIDRN